MPNITSPGSLPYPVDTDPIDVAGDIQGLAEAVDPQLVHYFANVAARDAWPNPPHGTLCITRDTTTLWRRNVTGYWDTLEGVWNYGGNFVSNVSGTANSCWRKIGRAIDWHGGWTGVVMAAPYAQAPWPCVSRSGMYWIGPALYRDVGSSWYNGICFFNNTTEIGFSTSVGGSGGQVDSLRPFTWGAGDQGAWQIRYEIAL